jgi:hypothetical protein
MERLFYLHKKSDRFAWDYTKQGRIAVPPGDYSDATKAVLFAGRYSDKTLLAVGVLTNVDGGTGTPAVPVTNIQVNTTRVTFTLSPLLNNIVANKSTSTFKITGPAGPPSYLTSAIPSDFPVGTIDGKEYPVFRVPRNTAILDPDPTDLNITATYEVTFPNIGGVTDTKAGIIIQQAGRLVSAGYAYNDDYGVTVEGTITPAGSAVTGVFDIEISTLGLGAGLSRLSIEVPVCAIDIAKYSPITWYIRGGISQNIFDEGVSANSLGGAILLAVGPVNINGIYIDTDWE